MHLFRCALLLAACHTTIFAADGNLPVTIRVDAAKTHGELKPIYRFFGADEPNYATMKDGKNEIPICGFQALRLRTDCTLKPISEVEVGKNTLLTNCAFVRETN